MTASAVNRSVPELDRMRPTGRLLDAGQRFSELRIRSAETELVSRVVVDQSAAGEAPNKLGAANR
jgi:hypothetical protein